MRDNPACPLPAVQDSESRTRSLLHMAWSGAARSCKQDIPCWLSVAAAYPLALSCTPVQAMGNNFESEKARSSSSAERAELLPIGFDKPSPAEQRGFARSSAAEQGAPAFIPRLPSVESKITPAAPAPTGFTRVSSADLGFTFTRACSFETEQVPLAVPSISTGLQAIVPLEPAAGEDAGLRAAFIKHFRRATTRATLLDGTELLREAMADCSEGGTFQTSMPMYSVYCTRWAAPIHLTLALTSLNKLVGCINLLVHDHTCEGRHFRFTPLERRGPSELWTGTAGPGIADFGLMYHGCGIGGGDTSIIDDSMVASFPEPVGINGWWFSTRLEAAALDPVRFVMEGSRDGATWELCGASRFKAMPSLSDIAFIGWSAGTHETTLARGAVEVFGLEVPWQFTVDHMLVMLTHTVANLWAFAVHFQQCPDQSHRVMLRSTFVIAGLYFISAIGYALQGNWTVAAIPGMYTLHFLGTCYTYCKMESVSRFQAHTSAGFAAAGIMQYLVIFNNSEGTWAIFDGYRAVLPLDVKTAFTTSFIFFCIYLWAKNGVARSIADARAVIAADEKEYDAAWAACLASRTDSKALDDIDGLMQATWGYLRPDILRQCARSPRLGNLQPINSFERIFAQAGAAAPLLRSKVKTWAHWSGGSFPVQHPDDDRAGCPGSVCFERWERIAGDAEMMGRVKWAKVKSEKRVVEKVYRCYAGDVSRLLDCCRYSIGLNLDWRQRITFVRRDKEGI